MSLGRTWAVALTGLDGEAVQVEADLSNQTPGLRIIGLPDKALGEAGQRVHNACANTGWELSRRRITVNLSPAHLPKQGSGFDLAIATAALATEHQLDLDSLATTAHIGELALDGRLRSVPGVLPATIAAARAGLRTVVVPYANREEAELVDGIRVFAAVALADVMRFHGGVLDTPEMEPIEAVLPAIDETRPGNVLDLADIVGQADATQALIVAAAGGHHLLMSGPPGAGKTMLAKRLPGILPALERDEALAVASMRSLSGLAVNGLSVTPPFEAPHHSVSMAALVGGGSRMVRPGAVARASSGVLFLDEAGEFSGAALDALRQPLESGTIAIDRAGFRAQFPARFQLILATNPCPCGVYGVPGAACVCPPSAIRRYLGRLSGPLRDRVDIELSLRRVAHAHLNPQSTTSSDVARDQVRAARDRATHRLAGTPWRRNADVEGVWLRQGPLSPETSVRRPLDVALSRGVITLRGYDRILRLAWSVADLAERSRLSSDDVGQALYLKRGTTP